MRRALAPAALATLIAATPALAVDRCVAPRTGCAVDYAQNQLQQALDDAGTLGTGRVLLGAATYTAAGTGFSLGTAGTVEIVGLGQGVTIITTDPGQPVFSPALALTAGAASVRSLTIRITGTSLRGLNVAAGTTARDIAVESTAAASPTGVRMLGAATLEDARVDVAGSDGIGVFMVAGGVMRTSTVQAQFAVGASAGAGPGSMSVERSRISASRVGIDFTSGTLRVSDSLVRATANNAVAVRAYNGNASAVPIVGTLDRVTLVGNPGVAQTGVLSRADSASGDDADVTVRSSIVTGFSTPLDRRASAGRADLRTSFSNIPLTGVSDTNSGTGTGQITHADRTGFPVVFANPAALDFSLTPGSPLIDAGDPADTGTLDLAGNARPQDGNDDGVTRVDIGAVEFPDPTPPPPAPGSPPPPAATPAPARDLVAPRLTGATVRRVGARIRVRARVGEPGRLTVRLVGARNRVLRTVAVPVRRAGVVSVSLPAPRPGRYRLTLRARDAAGNLSAVRVLSLRIR